MNTSDFFSLLVIAIGLSADCFTVALGGSISMRTVSALQILRVSLSFGFFQALMPLLGWLAGRTIADIISKYDHWVAFALLLAVGGRMIWESVHSKEKRKEGVDITKGLMLLTLSVATSIDSFAVGLSLAFLEVDIKMAVSVIGVTAFIITAIAFLLGGKIGKLVGKRAEAIGGVILIAIGIRILLAHIL